VQHTAALIDRGVRTISRRGHWLSITFDESLRNVGRALPAGPQPPNASNFAARRSECTLQQLSNLCKGFRSMADAVFFFAGKFRERFS
jgi:hypothetical protein